MVMSAPQHPIHTLEVVKTQRIKASVDIVYETVLETLGPGSERNGEPFPMVFEAWPGGRWWRDLGNNTGHFWGHVQVIKPPKLIEICGPLFMSYPAMSHVQYRITAEGHETTLQITHKAIGMIDPQHREGVNQGWAEESELIARRALQKATR